MDKPSAHLYSPFVTEPWRQKPRQLETGSSLYLGCSHADAVVHEFVYPQQRPTKNLDSKLCGAVPAFSSPHPPKLAGK